MSTWASRLPSATPTSLSSFEPVSETRPSGAQEEAKARVRAIIRGRVQGVGFRYFVADEARRLGLRGYVRNMPDRSSVELVAEGEKSGLDRLLLVVRKGPPGARVVNVDAAWSGRSGDYDDFRIEPY